MIIKSTHFSLLNLLFILISLPSYAIENASNTLKVQIVHPQLKAIESSIDGSGRAIAWENLIVAAQVDGLTITNLLVEIGDKVKKGQQLAILNTESLSIELTRYQALLASATAARHQATSEANIARSLAKKGGMAAHELNTALSNEQIALASQQVAQADVTEKKLALKHAKIIAPDDGIIVARPSRVGQVTSVDTELYTLQRHGRVEWLAEVNADDIGDIAIGQQVRIFDKNHHQITIGQVRRIAPLIDTTTNRAQVYVTLYDTPIKAGMFMTGKIMTGVNKIQLLPLSALTFEGSTSYIYLVDSPSNISNRIQVDIGQQYGEMIEIRHPQLNFNAQVILQGGVFLNNGDKVQIIGENKQ